MNFKLCIRVVVILLFLELVNQLLLPHICAFCHFEDSNYITTHPISVNSEANLSALNILLFLFCFSFFFRAIPAAHGGSQAKGQIQHSKAGSKLCLRSTPQLMAMPDP